MLLWLPNLLWQATHGWPQLELAADIRDEYSGVGPRLEFVGLLLVQFSPVAAALWIYGLVRLLRVPALVRAKPLAWAFLVLVVVFLVTGGKAYYVVGAVPVLLAAGACGLEERWSRRGLVVAGAVLALSAFVAWPAALPLLPERTFGASVYPEINDDQAEMIGWPALVDAVGRAVADSGAALVVTANYGEAGALEWYGSDVPVFSGHNGYAAWGPPAADLTVPWCSSGTRLRRTGRSGAVTRGGSTTASTSTTRSRAGSCRCATGRGDRGPTSGTRSAAWPHDAGLRPTGGVAPASCVRRCTRVASRRTLAHIT